MKRRSATRETIGDLESLGRVLRSHRQTLEAAAERKRQEAERKRQEAGLEAADEVAARLRSDGADCFRDSVSDATPLSPNGRTRVQHARTPTPAIARQRDADEREALAATMSDDIDLAQLLETDERLSFRAPGIDSATLAKLRRGHWVPQSQLDLHGMRTDEAREAVAQFLHHAVRDGLRCVRVIHGKGLGSLNRQPVLKDKVLRWLVQRNEVIAYCQAPPFAGGEGAVMVLLRSPRRPSRPSGCE